MMARDETNRRSILSAVSMGGLVVLTGCVGADSSTTGEINANYTQSERRTVGGKLILGENFILFEPHDFDDLLSGDKLEIAYSSIEDVGIQEPFSQGLIDTLFAGGLRKRLKIETQNGDRFLFVVSNIQEIVDRIDERAQSANTLEQSGNENATKSE